MIRQSFDNAIMIIESCSDPHNYTDSYQGSITNTGDDSPYEFRLKYIKSSHYKMQLIPIFAKSIK